MEKYRTPNLSLSFLLRDVQSKKVQDFFCLRKRKLQGKHFFNILLSSLQEHDLFVPQDMLRTDSPLFWQVGQSKFCQCADDLRIFQASLHRPHRPQVDNTSSQMFAPVISKVFQFQSQYSEINPPNHLQIVPRYYHGDRRKIILLIFRPFLNEFGNSKLFQLYLFFRHGITTAKETEQFTSITMVMLQMIWRIMCLDPNLKLVIFIILNP